MLFIKKKCLKRPRENNQVLLVSHLKMQLIWGYLDPKKLILGAWTPKKCISMTLRLTTILDVDNTSHTSESFQQGCIHVKSSMYLGRAYMKGVFRQGLNVKSERGGLIWYSAIQHHHADCGNQDVDHGHPQGS